MGGGPSDSPLPPDVPMEEATDFSEADKSSLTDESDDSGFIPGSHSENALHASEEEEGEGGKSERYSGPHPAKAPSPSLLWVDFTLYFYISQFPETCCRSSKQPGVTEAGRMRGKGWEVRLGCVGGWYSDHSGHPEFPASATGPGRLEPQNPFLPGLSRSFLALTE